jgi:choline dehydrogenase
MTSERLRSFDYVIVGAGSAGSTLASRLSEDPKARVCLIEAGPADSNLSIHVPAAQIKNMVSPHYSWHYFTEPQRGLGGRAIHMPMGRILGGSSSLNGMLYVRGDRWDYDHWAKFGCDGWAYEDVLPFFRKSEGSERGANHYHGGDGPLKVRKGTPGTAICEAFVEACAGAGERINDDFNGEDQEGFGYFDNTIHRGRRWSTASAFLRPAERRANLTVLTRALVPRIVLENGVARGVEVVVNGRSETVQADAEVILCAGAIGTPHLLMLSGVGPADHLRSVGVDVALDVPGVGANFQDHLGHHINIDCPLPVSAYRLLNPVRAFIAGVQYTLTRGGPLGRPSLPTGGFYKSKPDAEVADAQMHLTIAKLPEIEEVSGKIPLPSGHGFCVVVNQGRPASRGHVRLKSADPTARPAVDPNYLGEPSDEEGLFAAVAKVGELMERPEMRPYITKPGELPRRFGDRKVFRSELLKMAGSAFHPVGTCRMGTDAEAVVDPQLRMNGIRRLRIADASVMPTLINGNTNAPSIMIGERAAALISGR